MNITHISSVVFQNIVDTIPLHLQMISRHTLFILLIEYLTKYLAIFSSFILVNIANTSIAIPYSVI